MTDLEVLDLRDPISPSRALPRLLGRLIPNPQRSLEEWQRWRHLDIAGMSPRDKRLAAIQYHLAVGLLDDPRRTPTWILDRLDRLSA